MTFTAARAPETRRAQSDLRRFVEFGNYAWPLPCCLPDSLQPSSRVTRRTFITTTAEPCNVFTEAITASVASFATPSTQLSLSILGLQRSPTIAAGMCVVPSGRDYDSKKGGYLYLRQLGLVVKFPRGPASSFLQPPHKHGNIDIQPG